MAQAMLMRTYVRRDGGRACVSAVGKGNGPSHEGEELCRDAAEGNLRLTEPSDEYACGHREQGGAREQLRPAPRAPDADDLSAHHS